MIDQLNDLVQKRQAARASYDTRGRETDPEIDKVLRDAEDRKQAAEQFDRARAEGMADANLGWDKPGQKEQSPRETVLSSASSVASAMDAAEARELANARPGDYETGVRFWETLRAKEEQATGREKNALSDYSMSIYEQYDRYSKNTAIEAVGRDIRRGEGLMTWPHTYEIMGDSQALTPVQWPPRAPQEWHDQRDREREESRAAEAAERAAAPVIDNPTDRLRLDWRLDNAAADTTKPSQDVSTRPANRLLSEPVELTPRAKVASVVDKLERKYRGQEQELYPGI